MYDKYTVSPVNIFHSAYDLLIYLTHNFPHKKNRLIHELCERFQLKNKFILDIGCYTGYYSFFFHSERNKVTGVELNNKIEYARKRFRAYGINFIQGDILDVINQLEKNHFDFIFCSNFPGHYDTGSLTTNSYMVRLINAAMPLLSSDGIFYYIFYSTRHEKVTHPVAMDDVRLFLAQNDIKSASIALTQLIDYPAVEFICRK